MPAGGARQGAGRKKNVPNKDKRELVEKLAKAFPRWDPVMAMAEMANDKKNGIDLRFAASKEVAQYIHPKRKAIEHSGPDGQQLATLIVNVPPLPDGGPKR